MSSFAAVDQPVEHKCLICENVFPSRNKLYKHVMVCKNEPVIAGEGLNTPSLAVASSGSGKVKWPKALYVTGGRLRGRTLGSVERYDFETKVWEDCSKMSESRGSHGAAFIGSNLYVLGGGGFTSNLASCEKCDIATGTWSLTAPMSVYRHALAVVAVAPYIFAIGGWVDGTVCCNAVERYDTSTDSWDRMAPLITARRLHASALWNNQRIYVFGGNCGDGKWYSDAVEYFDLATNTWTNSSPLPVSGPASAMGIHLNILQDSSSVSSTAIKKCYVYVFMHGKHVYRYDPEMDSYTRLSALPLTEWYSFDISADRATDDAAPCIFLVGGSAAGVWSKTCWCYHVLSDTFEELPPMRLPRRRVAVAVH